MADESDPRGVRALGGQRFTVTLVAKAVEALEQIRKVTGFTKADSINRSVQIYAFFASEVEAGKEVLLRDKDGALERVHIV